MPDLSIPQNDAPFLSWASGFLKTIRKRPSAFGVSQADVDAIEQVVGEYRDALRLTEDEGTRTKVTVMAKNNAKVSAMQLMRLYVSVIQPNKGVSDEDKVALGLHIRSRGLTRREVPPSSPLLKYIGSTPGSHTLAYADSATPASSRKPYGAAGLQVFMSIGDEPAYNANDARYVGEFTRSPFGVLHEPVNARKVVSYFARWIGHRKDVGPWSLPVHAVVPWPGGAEGESEAQASEDGELRLAA
ncbi:MAG: hypothetical protein EA377_13025 [Phycisphaerales bacterium]|nr:MAG: hypothetical protein EA377_13025 [Phycisphaerales bacterium]